LPDLSKKRERERLKVKRDPYYTRLAEGAYLGFRRGPNTWTARFRDRKGVQHYEALTMIATDDYDGAVQAALEWFGKMGGAVHAPKRETMKAALQAYLADLKRHGRGDTAKGQEGIFKTIAYKDRIAARPLEDLTRDDFLEYRDRLTSGRAARSVNRQYGAVEAGLNYAVDELGYVGNANAWQLKRLADDVEDEADTAVFLDAAQRKAIIAAAESRAADFFRGLELTGARPKELAALIAGDFDGKTVKLSHRKGRPLKVRTRQTVLGTDGVTFFTKLAAAKLPRAPLFTEDGSQPMRRHTWGRAFRAAADLVNGKADEEVKKGNMGFPRIPDEASAYSFRHARISELLQVYHIDPLTVGAQCGTSLAMIEKSYWKFIPSALADKLAALKEAT
jgi:integrase